MDDLRVALRSIKHRGPDQTGVFQHGNTALGMVRLAVLDLTSRNLCPYVLYYENSNKPRIALTYNGEIFNFREIREELEKEGHIFESTGDTEVLAKAYLQWGQNCLSHFNGMFAFALADYENDLMFCARDIAGEKPLYYSQQCDHFIIASEIKAILAYSGLTEIHLTDDFRAFEYMTGAETLFEGIMSVLPGEQLLIRRMSSSRDDLERKNYWNINDEIIEIPGDRVVDYLDELLHDAVRLRLRSDVPMGLYLSGGIDSSLLAYFIKPDVAFSVSFPYGPKYDEIEYARMVAKEIGCEHYVLSPTSCDFKHTLDDVLYHLDMPVGSFSAFPLYILAKKASEHVKVIFSGEGADELFSGYTRYLLPYWDEQAYQVPQLENYHPLLDYYYGQALDRFAKLLNRGLVNDEKMKAIIFPFFSQFDDIRHAMGFTEFKLMLVTLLHMEDRMSAAFGIENRSPFLDKRIISFAYSIPGDWKIKGTETKRIVRELASRYIPKAILERKEKLGLIAPINLWMGFSGVRGEFDRTTYNRLCFEHWKHVFFVEKRHTKPSPSVKPVEVY